MANRIPKLTRRAVEALKANGADTVYWDGELTGFGVRVRKSGRKNYVLQTRVRGKLRWYTIGQLGRITPDEARVAALEILAQAKMGSDPRDADAKQKAEPVMTELGRRFLEEYVPTHCKPSTQGEYRRSVQLFIDPAIGKMRISEVERKDIAKLHFDLRDKPYKANRTLGVLSKMFNLAELWELRSDGSNPCRHVKRFKEENRERFLSDDEYRRLGSALRDIQQEGSETPAAIAAIRLLMLTGCRLSEIQKLRWEHVDLEAGELKLPDTKSGAKVVYLGEPAIAVLRGIEREDDNPWVIVGRKEHSYLTDLQHPWRRIRARAGLDDLRIHDLRHSFASGGLLFGEGLPMIGKLLGHTQVQTTARFAHLANDPVKSAANRIANRIAEVTG